MSEITKVTPRDIAEELGRDPKEIRKYLRAGFERPGKNWEWETGSKELKGVLKYLNEAIAQSDQDKENRKKELEKAKQEREAAKAKLREDLREVSCEAAN
ncbi:MAG: hypothetical protein ACRCR2_05145 [Fusobacteriaceae bacterium]